jgi:hypothetical protein
MLIRRALFTLMLGSAGWALPPMTQPRPTEPAVLVLDAVPSRPAAKNYRTCAQLAAAFSGDKRGLAELRASGSGAFSRAEIARMSAEWAGPVTVVDLRQETHALINGLPVTWYAPVDWGNVGKSNSEVWRLEAEQIAAVDHVLQLSPVKGDENAVDDTLHMEVERAESEEDVVHDLGLGYLRLYVTDHLRPTDAEVDRFVQFVDEMPEDMWLHFHCRAGKGRTTTFLCMYDMLANADQVSFDDILARQAALPPNYHLLDTRPRSPRHVYYQQRADFLREFYKYARARKPAQSWSEWVGR